MALPGLRAYLVELKYLDPSETFGKPSAEDEDRGGQRIC
jgi:hypothetical protein